MEGLTEAALHHAFTEAREQHQRIRLVACAPSELALALRLHAELGGDVALEHRAASDALLPELAAGGMPIILSVARSRGEQSVYGLAAQLMRLGAVVALSTDHPTARIHHLPLCAGLCLRFGIGNEFPKGGQIDYVLGKFNDDDMKLMPERLETAAEIIKSFCLAGLNITMNQFNNK